jgi:hypothetical protein
MPGKLQTRKKKCDWKNAICPGGAVNGWCIETKRFSTSLLSKGEMMDARTILRAENDPREDSS